MTIELFEIGGCVRDEIMGQKPHDIDFTCIAPSFEAMTEFVASQGLKIVQSKPEFGTIIAVTAKEGFRGHRGGIDFVWAREEGPYSDGRRPDWTKPGTLFMDQSRRDFTMNAVAKDVDGNLIDPFNGVLDIKNRKIRCVGNAEDRLREDALRGLRALRFSVTKGMVIDGKIIRVLDSSWFPGALTSVSKERQREEMEKMFAHDTLRSIRLMERFHEVAFVVFSGGLRLTATMKEK
jgi:tRNA nucleotidyltransferase (CCA-adding enzyme)